MKCICLAEDLNDTMIERYQTMDDGGCWAVYRECPVHHAQAVAPVWNPVYDLSKTKATAVKAVAVGKGLL